MTETVKILKDDESFRQLVKDNPLKYKVSAKFDDDHIIKASLSKKNSIEAAIERYKRNQKIKKSSWIMIDKATLLNKARAAGAKIAHIHGGGQQLATTIKVTRRTVEIDELTPKERQRYKHEEVKVGKETKYLNCTSEEATVSLKVVGRWDPFTGECDIYHYEEGEAGGSHKLLDKFKKWVCDEKGKPIRLEAKK
jgi:hypothetical protein